MSHPEDITRATNRLIESYTEEPIKIHHLDRQPLPSHTAIINILTKAHELIFPGYVGAQGLGDKALLLHVEKEMADLHQVLTEQIRRAINHGQDIHAHCVTTDVDPHICATEFLKCLPEIRHKLALDVKASYDGDPAASCLDEIIFSYPGIYAVMVYRLAHELYKMRVPLIPRIMTEHAHHRTGIDIHPGTRIGSRFFIDHGTGVVIGGTAVIGSNVKVYQGVTLGAFSFPLNESGELVRHTKRHPTIEDDVVIYSGATILGGDTIIGRGSVIGGNVWLTQSVAPHTRVTQEAPKLRITQTAPTAASGK